MSECSKGMSRSYGETRRRYKEDPKIWLIDRSYEWHYLADSFTQYFRMMLVHQDLPQWSFRFTPMGLTPWAEKMIFMICPHLLAEQNVHSPRFDSTLNQIDPSANKKQKL